MDTTREGKLKPESLPTPISSDPNEPKKTVTRLSAKRKYWVEWECLFDKFPTEDQQEKLKEELKAYIENYLDLLARGDYGKAIPKTAGDSQYSSEPNVIDQIHDEIETLFSENSDTQQKSYDNTSSPKGRGEKLEFSVWDIKSWQQIDEQSYIKIVKENEDKDKESVKLPLKYTLYSKKWINIYEHKLVHVSDSYLVFSYQGWFETKNRVRLTDESGENRGSMNPPNPPPPPK